MDKQVKFNFGIFDDDLEKQANEQGFTLGKDFEKLERIRKAVNMCMFHVATEVQVQQMFKKLRKQVIETMKPLEK